MQPRLSVGALGRVTWGQQWRPLWKRNTVKEQNGMEIVVIQWHSKQARKQSDMLETD